MLYYALYNEEALNVNEHNIKFATIINFEYGQKFVLNNTNDKFALLLGLDYKYER